MLELAPGCGWRLHLLPLRVLIQQPGKKRGGHAAEGGGAGAGTGKLRSGGPTWPGYAFNLTGKLELQGHIWSAGMLMLKISACSGIVLAD